MAQTRIFRFSVRFGVGGAIFGVFLAILLMTLTLMVRVYPLAGFIEHLTFRLCPLLILGFGLKSWTGLIAVVLFSNAVLYGIPFAVAGAVVGAFTKGVSARGESRRG